MLPVDQDYPFPARPHAARTQPRTRAPGAPGPGGRARVLALIRAQQAWGLLLGFALSRLDGDIGAAWGPRPARVTSLRGHAPEDPCSKPRFAVTRRSA